MKSFLSLVASLVLLVSIPLNAGIVNGVNPGFEEPDKGKIQDDFRRIPGWSQDLTTDSGVESTLAYAGVYCGFGRASDGPIYQSLNDTFTPDLEYRLTFYGRSTSNASSITAYFYYLENPAVPTSRTVITSQIYSVSDTWTEYTLTLPSRGQ